MIVGASSPSLVVVLLSDAAISPPISTLAATRSSFVRGCWSSSLWRIQPTDAAMSSPFSTLATAALFTSTLFNNCAFDLYFRISWRVGFSKDVLYALCSVLERERKLCKVPILSIQSELGARIFSTGSIVPGNIDSNSSLSFLSKSLIRNKSNRSLGRIPGSMVVSLLILVTRWLLVVL